MILRYVHRFIALCSIFVNAAEGTRATGLPLYYWKDKFVNFGDYLSLKIVERMVGVPIEEIQLNSFTGRRKLLALGSILTFARDHDVIWGSGINGKWTGLNNYKFKKLDVRAVRGPLTREFLMTNFAIEVPEIYGDPALLLPLLFPEFKKSSKPRYEYLIIPHYSEEKLFPKHLFPQVVYPSEPWDVVIEKILDSKLVISSSLHGIIVAEAFGIPARMVRITENEALFKYQDYFLGTNRPAARIAYSIEQAIKMGGEAPPRCNLEQLYYAFPFEFWPGNGRS
jgi:pyruvyltransferase